MGYVVCDVWQAMDVMLCTSSIWHMCTISIDRYIGIRYPLKAAAAARLNRPAAYNLTATLRRAPLLIPLRKQNTFG